MKLLSLSSKSNWKLFINLLCSQSKLTRTSRPLCDQRINFGPSKDCPTRFLGQPTFHSHPHLLKSNELVPGFTRDEFIKRREKLVTNILNTNVGAPHVVLVPSSTVQYMTEKIPYVFRQNTDFRYLTGCLEPDCALLLIIQSINKYRSVLFLRPKNSHSELWEGPRTGIEIAPDLFGVDDAKPIKDLEDVLKGVDVKNFTLWYDSLNPVNSFVHKCIVSYISAVKPQELKEVRSKIHELRVIKSEAEQALMIKSAEIASNAIKRTIMSSKPGETEHQLFATVDYLCRMDGAEFLAYPPVVAAGENANVIHYISNTQQIKDGDLILMDAGCELHGYASDITRTWPVNGKFSPCQQTLYDVVLSVQLDLITASKEISCLDEMFLIMCKLLGQRLKEAHILTKGACNMTLDEVAFKLCPHHVGHYLGMDVHDTATISRKTQLKEGMVITIEPGIYINSSNYLVKPEFRGIGIRVEDDILFTKTGPKVMSSCPKDVVGIEALNSR